ncbi:putative mitochondrial hypothetical protein [Leptomonas pyrrhocoris]|uniref:SAM domain-containing protein n=1 Tax=Leptomonas pyrrhocoris TaxID=157538 RepID=A0A0N0DVQ9_LEPPY|nr:putative mitochondrial hypothetical protein [Leptomonas pyrrhocoris]KPA80692.1 putative mitochondrial hypothetical protein [Leptomonas pyrrhocoris]|eukprot:XP_015659131.1 putative mitochondrial hypothetical protein [Leptomonas pyrrhocoris]
MSLLSPPQKTTLVAVVAGAVAGVAALTWSVVQLHRRRDASNSESAGVPPESWTKAQVAAWLHDNGVSKHATALCRRFNLTGEALLQVTERDLYRMGVPLRDARVVLAAVEDLKESPVLLARASQARTSRQPSLASISSRLPAAVATPVTTASPGERFEAAWNALVRTCVLPSDGASPTEQQQRVVVYTSALLECFQALSSREQATALALVAAVEDNAAPAPVVSSDASPRSPPVKNPAAPAMPDAAAAADSLREVETKLQPLHSMVDSFLKFLQSPELDAVSAADFEELSARVAGQVKRVARVCEQLPAEMGGPLLRKCEKVFEALARRQVTAAASLTSQEETRKPVMQALYEVIAEVKDPATRDLPPAQRVAVLSALVERAESIEALASGAVEGASKDDQALQLVQPLLRFLREAVRVGAETAALEAEGEAAAAAQQDDVDEEEEEGAEGNGEGRERGMTNADIPVIVDTIQRIQETLQSAEFRHAPAEVQAQLCAVLTRRISALEDRIDTLPAPTRSAGRELLQNTKSVLTAVGNAAAVAAHRVADPDEVANGKDEGDAAEGAENAAAVAPVGTVGVERCVAQLEKIFEFLSSEALEQAPADERAKMANELVQRVDNIKDTLKGSPAEGPIVKELIQPLYDLLKSVATTQVFSQQFLDITAPLRDVQELLNSTPFQQLPHVEKMRIARGIVPQLQQLTTTLGSLPPSERAAAEELVRPISEELLRIVRERPATEVTAQSVLGRLQTVLRTIQGAEFTTMTPAGRSEWAADAVAELQRLSDDCVALGPEGDALRPIVERLEKQLRSLFSADSNAEGEKAPATNASTDAPAPESGTAAAQSQGDDDAQSIWTTVRAMQGELARTDAQGTFTAPARLQQMLSVLGEVAEATSMTDAQERLLQDFGEELRKHVEGVTAAPNNAEGEAEAGEEAADDALESLRVSLQTLLDVAQEDGGASGAELASIAAKTEEIISMADEAGVKWRDDAQCGRAVRGILGLLQQTRTAGGPGSGGGAAAAARGGPSKVEEVLQSSIKALSDAPPTTEEDFLPFMRVLQLAQPAAERMTNRELVLLKTLQESVIEAMRRLPEPPRPVGEVDNNGAHAMQEREEEQAEAGAEEEGEGTDDVDAVLDALLDMSFKLRDRSYTSAQLDEFEAIQHDLEDLLTRAGVDATEAMASVREQIHLQRKSLRLAEGNDDDSSSSAAGEGENEGEDEDEDETSPLGAAVVVGEEADGEEEGAARASEVIDAFSEDDDDGASDGAAVAAAVVAPTHAPQQAEDDGEREAGEEMQEEVAKP